MKRKMLSMNRRTSRPSSSRKYSAIVRPVSATRWRAPGGSFIWPNTNAVLARTPDSVISCDEVVALAAALADAGEHGVARVLLGDVPDQLLDDDRLADAGAAEDADLAALLERADQVDDLEAGLEDLDLGRLLVERRAARGGSAGSRSALDRALVVDRAAEDVEHAAEGRLADRDARSGRRCRRTSTPRARPSVVVMATERTQLLPRCCWTSQTSGSWPWRWISTAL